MENRAYAIAVGLFALLLGCALLFSFWWMNDDHKSNTSYLVVSQLPVTGLNVESAVKFRGVSVGKVTDITFAPADQSIVQIGIQVQEDLALTSTSYAELRLQGITGLAYIDLNDQLDGDRTVLMADAEIPMRSSRMDQLLEAAPALLSELDSLIRNSNTLVSTSNQLLESIEHTKFNQTLSNLETASSKLEPLLDNAAITLNRIASMASKQNQTLLTEALVSMQRSTEAAQPLFNDLRNSAQEFRSVTSQIGQDSQQLSHTLNNETLPHIHTLTENLNRDLRQLGTLLNTLEENPQSLVFGKPTVRPGPGELGFNPEN